jgi:hypothetical protein
MSSANLNWCDFYSLIEHPQRPVEWSASSVIFTPHPTQPLVLARHFSSSKQFTVPSPGPILSSPASYGPPSLISGSPDDEWLFAFYPGRGSDGAGCLWKRGHELDSWIIQESWSYAPSAGVVAASWLGAPRQWTTDTSGNSVRLPPLGPRTPVSSPTLALVTQNHQFTVCYVRNYVQSLQMVSCPLTHGSLTVESQRNLGPDISSGVNTIRLCISASIGLSYNGQFLPTFSARCSINQLIESSILVATRSQVFPLPPPVPVNSQFNSVDLTLSLDLNDTQVSDPSSQPVDETCGEEQTIDICEVELGYDSKAMSKHLYACLETFLLPHFQVYRRVPCNLFAITLRN